MLSPQVPINVLRHAVHHEVSTYATHSGLTQLWERGHEPSLDGGKCTITTQEYTIGRMLTVVSL